MNEMIETQGIWWFDLGVSHPKASRDWADTFVRLFPLYGVEVGAVCPLCAI